VTPNTSSAQPLSHGTICVSLALGVSGGSVITAHYRRHKEFLWVPQHHRPCRARELDLHLIHATHETPPSGFYLH
jgi:hypothetical protein